MLTSIFTRISSIRSSFEELEDLLDIPFSGTSRGKEMSKYTESGLKNLKTQFLIGILVVTPILFVAGHVQSVFAAGTNDSPKVCVIATLNSNPSVVASFGPCPKVTISPSEDDREPRETPSSDPTAISPEPTTTVEPTQTTTEPSPTTTETTEDPNSTIESPSPTTAPTTEEPYTHTESPSPTVVPTTEDTHTESPSPSPSPSTTQTTSEVYDIPPENKDPNTKEFRFCHHGSPHSNSYTGMMSGHHDKHAEDIIPPIPFKFYPGWNWTEENAKTFYNNCVPVS